MYNGQKVYCVHGHVTAPDAYRAGATGLMASNTPQAQSVLMQPNDRRPGPLQDENFKQTVLKGHVEYMDARNIDVQIIGPRPFLMLGWMSQDILPSWTRLTNDAIGKRIAVKMRTYPHPERSIPCVHGCGASCDRVVAGLTGWLSR